MWLSSKFRPQGGAKTIKRRSCKKNPNCFQTKKNFHCNYKKNCRKGRAASYCFSRGSNKLSNTEIIWTTDLFCHSLFWWINNSPFPITCTRFHNLKIWSHYLLLSCLHSFRVWKKSLSKFYLSLTIFVNLPHVQ